MSNPKIGPALTWDDLANLYPGKARIMPMDAVFNWFKQQKNKYWVHPKEGTIHKRLEIKP